MSKDWFKQAVGYQIYPRSFQDTNGDGIGDLQGIIKRLPVLKDLGIDFIWINPVYASPNIDNGYDISDFKAINPEFGTMEEMKEVIQKAHDLGIKVIMDLVINHTSDQHPWFIEAKQSKDNPYRDYYHWHPATKTELPNDWKSFFGGPTWTYDEKTEEAYFHIFAPEQPDLNWNNAKMREEIYGMIRWWLEQGIDGFRLDAISHIQKEPWSFKITDNQWAPFMNVKGIETYMSDLQSIFDEYGVMTVGEASGVTSKEAREWTDESGYLDMIFDLEHMVRMGEPGSERIDPSGFKKVIQRWQNDLQPIGWHALYIENHDLPRSISSFGDGSIHSAKGLGMAYFFLRGTPFIYQGQELGIENYPFQSIDEINATEVKRQYDALVAEGVPEKDAFKRMTHWTRDHSRTPIHWTSEEGAGFSTTTPWMPIHPNYVDRNVQKAQADSSSLWHFYRDMIALRKSSLSLTEGSISFYLKDHPNVLCYVRSSESEQYAICVNLSNQTQIVDLPGYIVNRQKQCVMSNQSKHGMLSKRMTFEGFDAYIIKLENV